MTGPAVAYPDGWAIYAVHGVRVPAHVIESPKSITVEEIEKETNAEVRRVMMERYGLDRYIKDSGAHKVHSDDWGTLWRKDVPDDEPLVMVEVLNSTPEPDGSFKTYFLRCDPQLRPLPDPAWDEEKKRDWMRQQEPQEMTAHNAIASTWGLRGDAYHPALQT